jgi:hypothetical protein
MYLMPAEISTDRKPSILSLSMQAAPCRIIRQAALLLATSPAWLSQRIKPAGRPEIAPPTRRAAEA